MYTVGVVVSSIKETRKSRSLILRCPCSDVETGQNDKGTGVELRLSVEGR